MALPGNLNGTKLWNLNGLGFAKNGKRSPGDKVKRKAAMQAKLAAMSPDQKAAWQAKMKAKLGSKKSQRKGWTKWLNWIGL